MTSLKLRLLLVILIIVVVGGDCSGQVQNRGDDSNDGFTRSTDNTDGFTGSTGNTDGFTRSTNNTDGFTGSSRDISKRKVSLLSLVANYLVNENSGNGGGGSEGDDTIPSRILLPIRPSGNESFVHSSMRQRDIFVRHIVPLIVSELARNRQPDMTEDLAHMVNPTAPQHDYQDTVQVDDAQILDDDGTTDGKKIDGKINDEEEEDVIDYSLFG
ncbi:hypothetical protein Pcinc_027770 [Petrolisthes cinctipes]|uniref:Uncharacterized protein n=1 Tax=Petrolisthes cinctipes TaxID=88211 RepID=A0AAE1K9U2_PETCI|nr:hypothetical protein Pcinc_027770 [Petrolisthes cinctipes]